jgi:hypothetical protein
MFESQQILHRGGPQNPAWTKRFLSGASEVEIVATGMTFLSALFRSKIVTGSASTISIVCKCSINHCSLYVITHTFWCN